MSNISSFLPNLDIFFILFIPAVIGIVCHEVAHGYCAYVLGDSTAKFLGRLTLNPLKHIDQTGLLVFIFTALFTPFVIGWAKPVPVNSRHFKKPREDMMLVAFAGPVTNFLLALVFAVIATLLDAWGDDSTILGYIAASAYFGVRINCTLAWFNLLPIPPLDGSHILFGMLPRQLAIPYHEFGRYGFILLLAFLYFGLFGKILGPLISGTSELMFNAVSFLQPHHVL